MTDVLLIASTAPVRLALDQGVRELTRLGCTVDLVSARAPGSLGDLPLRERRTLTLLRHPAGRPATGLPGRVFGAVRYRVLKRVNPRTGPALRTWRLFRQDPAARQAAERADLVVALDRTAVYTAWRLARRRQVPAVYGLTAAVEEVSR